MAEQTRKELSVVKFEALGGVVEFTISDVRELMVKGGGKLTDKECIAFMQLCKFQKLNPWTGEAYPIKFGEDFQMVVGYTLKELADEITKNSDLMTALQDAIGKKLTKPETDGTKGQILKRDADGNLIWEDEKDTTYGNASSTSDGLMSSADKSKLDEIGTDAKQTVSADEKSVWNGKMDANAIIDGGSF